MGAGGRMTEPESPAGPDHTNPNRSPSSKPPFTLSDLKKAIPPHCFKRSLLKSFYHLVHDLVFSSCFSAFAIVVIPALPAGLQLASWPLYWALQGCVLTGVWVIAHECGHHAFSDYQLLDDALGLALHSSLLVPYFSWKISHRRHHSNTGSIDRDEVFVPKPKSSLAWFSRYLSNNPVGRLLTLVVTVTLGWPLYLAFNVSGRPYPRRASHFDPNAPIYNDRERALVLVSDVGLVATVLVLAKLVGLYGFWWVVRIYGVPLLIVNGWLVTITYLQHTHLALPHYDGEEWDWLRGALSTMDRDYGLLNRVFHNITDTHVVHHLFSTMPHYNAMEATKAVRPVLGEYYQFDGTPVVKAMWREARECVYVEADDGGKKGVFWYRNKF